MNELALTIFQQQQPNLLWSFSVSWQQACIKIGYFYQIICLKETSHIQSQEPITAPYSFKPVTFIFATQATSMATLDPSRAAPCRTTASSPFSSLPPSQLSLHSLPSSVSFPSPCLQPRVWFLRNILSSTHYPEHPSSRFILPLLTLHWGS